MPLEHSLATEMLIEHVTRDREAAAGRARTLRRAQVAAAGGVARDRHRSRLRRTPVLVGRAVPALLRRVGGRLRGQRAGPAIGTDELRSGDRHGWLAGGPAACAARP